MTSKVMGSIKGPYLRFPDSYGLGFADERAEHRGNRQGTVEHPSLDMLKTQGSPHQTLVLALQWLLKIPSNPYFLMTLRTLDKGCIICKSTKLFAAICFCFLEFGFSTCLTVSVESTDSSSSSF